MSVTTRIIDQNKEGWGFCAWLGTLRETAKKILSILVGEGETCETFKLVPPPDSEITLFDSNSACFKVNPDGPIDNVCVNVGSLYTPISEVNRAKLVWSV